MLSVSKICTACSPLHFATALRDSLQMSRGVSPVGVKHASDMESKGRPPPGGAAAVLALSRGDIAQLDLS